MNSFIPAKEGKIPIQARCTHVSKSEEAGGKEFHEWAGDSFLMECFKGLWYKQNGFTKCLYCLPWCKSWAFFFPPCSRSKRKVNTLVGKNDTFLGISEPLLNASWTREATVMTLFYLPQLWATSESFSTISHFPSSTPALLHHLWKPLTKSPVAIFLSSLPCCLSHAGVGTKPTCITSQSQLLYP